MIIIVLIERFSRQRFRDKMCIRSLFLLFHFLFSDDDFEEMEETEEENTTSCC